MTTTEDPVPTLVGKLRNRASHNRLGAVRALAKLGPAARDALPALVALLDDPDAAMREAVAGAVGQVGPEAVPALTRMLTHPDKYVRRHAVWAFGRLGIFARGVLTDLCKALQDDDPRTAAGAAQALGGLGAEAAGAIPQLMEAMRGTNVVLCRLAAKALSQIGDPALPDLIAHLKHHDPFVRGEAALALGWMGPAAAPAVPLLAEAVRPKAARTTNPFGQETGRFAPPKASEPPPPEDGCRAAAAQALGRIGPAAAAALPVLQRAALDPCDAVQEAAALAIQQITAAV